MMNTAGIMCIQARAKDSKAFFYYGVDTLKHDDVYPERSGVYSVVPRVPLV